MDPPVRWRSVRSRRRPAAAALYSGARLIVGDGGVIEDGAFLVRDGQIAAIGRKGAVDAPAGAARVDLTGKTVMPAMINAHVHIGYEGYTTWGAENYTAQNVLDHLEREAFYGVARDAVGREQPAGAVAAIRARSARR